MKATFTTKSIAVVTVVSFFLTASSARAAFVTIDVDVLQNANPPASGPPSHAWGHLPNNNAFLVLGELFDVPEFEDSYDLRVSGIRTGQPSSTSIISLIKEVENALGLAWIGFHIDLDPSEAPTFVGTASSDTLTLISQTPHSLVFGLPSPVLPGATVAFSFDIAIPAAGPFGFTLSQLAVLIPEPATILLVGWAVVLTILSRRRRGS